MTPGTARATTLVLLLAAVVGPATSGSLLGAPASAAQTSTPSLGVPALASLPEQLDRVHVRGDHHAAAGECGHPKERATIHGQRAH